jgi:hypothetical protein
MSKKVKQYCVSLDCSFKPVKFNTFEYMYCSTCKEEVDEDLVERKARYKATKSNNVNPHLENKETDDFDLWSLI